MKIEITYPRLSKRALQRQDIIKYAKWPFLLAAYICPILNITLGGPAWSVIVLWSMWLAWSLGLSTDLVEYNRISQFVKLVVNSSILLVLIDLLLSPGWAADVVPIVFFGGLTVAGVLFFTDMEKQRHNMMPMLFMTAACFVSAIAGLIFLKSALRWALVVMGACSIALFAACLLVLGGDLLREFRKRFHTR